MPNVPKLPGVPLLSGYSIGGAVRQLIADAFGLLSGSIQQQWGLFDGNEPIIFADSVVTVDYKQSWNISDYPIEKGGFTSYDKVETPFETRLRFACGGSEAKRQAFLDSIAEVAGDLNLYDVVTPEQVYLNVNITRYDYKRSATNGNGLIVVDIWCVEIRVAEEASFGTSQNSTESNSTTEITVRPAGTTKSPTSASPVNGGTVQTSAPTSQESDWVYNANIM